MPPSARDSFWTSLSAKAKADLLYRWSFWARDAQLPPPDTDWRVWLILAGRGFGKTRTALEWLRAEVESGRRRRLAIVARTAADVRDVLVEGESGILRISPPWFRPHYEPSKRRLTWPNGAIATTYSADEPDNLRGPEHDGAVCDELAAWENPEAWDMLLLGLRIGTDPRAVVATTPRPTKVIRDLIASPTTHVTRGRTYDNAANLAPAFLSHIIRKYEGTRMGRQELDAEILDDTPGALWKRDTLDALRVLKAPDAGLARIVVAIDPAVTADEGSDETGIIAAGVGAADVGPDGQPHGYVLEDASLRGTPHQWASAAVTLYHKLRADRIIAECNQGGQMVEHTIRTVDPDVPVTLVHASRGKLTRAEPVAALYEQARAHHVGTFPALEDQLCTWTQGDTSPDRLDALVWAFTDLIIGAHEPRLRFFAEPTPEVPPQDDELDPAEQQAQLAQRQADLLDSHIRRMRSW